MKAKLLVHGVELYRHQVELLPLALGLHMIVTGAGDDIPGNALLAYEMVRARLDDWHVPESEFDRSVRVLCEKACEEYAAAHLDEDRLWCSQNPDAMAACLKELLDQQA
jgi:hypothetical protein